MTPASVPDAAGALRPYWGEQPTGLIIYTADGHVAAQLYDSRRLTGVPEVIPVEMCYLGWQESLVQVATLVEPEMPG